MAPSPSRRESPAASACWPRPTPGWRWKKASSSACSRATVVAPPKTSASRERCAAQRAGRTRRGARPRTVVAVMSLAPLRRSRLSERSGCPGLRLASYEEQDGDDEEAQAGGSVGWRVDSDQEPRNAEQDRDRDGRARMAVERNPRRDRRDYESHASDAAEDTEGANQDVLGEVLDQVFPQRLVRLRESVQLVDQNPDADPLEHLPRAVEDDEGHERDSADPRCGPLDAAQEQKDGDGHQGDEEHHPDVDHQEARHVVLRIQVDLVALPAGTEEEQNRPQERDADQEGEFSRAEGAGLVGDRPGALGVISGRHHLRSEGGHRRSFRTARAGPKSSWDIACADACRGGPLSDVGGK